MCIVHGMVLTFKAEDRKQCNAVRLPAALSYPAFISSKQFRQQSFSSFTEAINDTESFAVREYQRIFVEVTV